MCEIRGACQDVCLNSQLIRVKLTNLDTKQSPLAQPHKLSRNEEH